MNFKKEAMALLWIKTKHNYKFDGINHDKKIDVALFMSLH